MPSPMSVSLDIVRTVLQNPWHKNWESLEVVREILQPEVHDTMMYRQGSDK